MKQSNILCSVRQRHKGKCVEEYVGTDSRVRDGRRQPPFPLHGKFKQIKPTVSITNPSHVNVEEPTARITTSTEFFGQDMIPFGPSPAGIKMASCSLKPEG